MTARSKYIGGGTIAAVINASPHKTALELWEEMVEGVERPISPERAKFFRRRQQMEPVIIRMLEEDHGIIASKISFHEPNRYRDREHPFFAAEIDFETVMTPGLAERFPRLADIPTGETINGEVKTWAEWGKSGWGEVEQEQIPTQVAAQVEWGLGVTERRAALVCPLFGLDELRVYPVLADAAVIKWLREEALAFWQMVQERRMPAPKRGDLDDLKRACSRLVGVPVELDYDTFAALDAIWRYREKIRQAEKDLERDEFRVFDFVRKAWSVPSDPTVDMPTDNAILEYGGSPVAVWRRQTREGIDVKRLKESEPMTYHRFRKDSVYRVLSKPPKMR